MRQSPPPAKLHRQASEYPPLAEGGPTLVLPPWDYAQNRRQQGRLPTGGCLYGGQSTTFWAPVRDRLHLTDGPIGCSVYAQPNRPYDPGPNGIAGFAGLNLSTDFRERDVVFGGEPKLARALAEAETLFPLNHGVTVLSTCPVALIGDDIDAVARRHGQASGKPANAVHCAGFRRADGIGDTHAALAADWRARARPTVTRHANSVALLCRDMHGGWRHVAALLGALGLEVVARWPAAANTASMARLGDVALAVCVDMEYWGRLLQRQFGVDWINVSFLGPSATDTSLRAIAARFDHTIRDRAEALIAEHSPPAHAAVAAARPLLAGRLYLSFAPLLPHTLTVYREFGIRAGSSMQGWPLADGSWHAGDSRSHGERSPAEVEHLLAIAQPDLVDGLGQDAACLGKRGHGHIDDAAARQLAHAQGYAGTPGLVRLFLRLFAPPHRPRLRAPWRC